MPGPRATANPGVRIEVMITRSPQKSFLPHWRTDPKEIAAELEAAGWRLYKGKRGSHSYHEARLGEFDFYRGPTHKLTPIAPGAQRAMSEVIMGRPAPKREIDR
jgi:hypothetical protein